ncbi:MAG: right-handed parallel beta-helix repeat-containing protein, partial [Chitinophagales bacterium]|nr:right-handed parallel beta-helix repeat-containing protein [Chitinophagales bacterium]
GINNNFIFGNDFSDASNNGVESTFSKNNIIYNRIERCDYGIWGGYSYYTLMGLNQFADNNTAVAIEHGQHNQLLMNTFSGDQLGVKIWANPNQSAQWEYPKFRDTRSTNYWIENNLFKGNNMVIDITNSDSIEINNNEFADAVEIYKPDFKSRMINFGADGIKLKPEDFSKFKKAFEPDATAEIPAVNVFAGRENMIVTNWGPYDFQRPLLKMMSADTSKIYFKVYGPLGKWRVKRWKGVTDFSRTTGLRNDTFSAKIIHHAENAPTDILLELEYVGTAVVDEFGNEIPERNSVFFSYQKYELPIGWKVNYYKMDTFNPAKYPGVFKNAIKLGVKKTESVNKLEYSWNGAPDSKLNDDHFALVATATQNFVKGNYSFGITADDGVRFYVDDKLVMDEWDATKYRFNDELHHEVTLPLEGIHQLKVEYYDQTGFATLMMTVQKL